MHMQKTKFFLFGTVLLLIVCASLSGSAQEATSRPFFSARMDVFQGFIIEHSDRISHLTNSYPTGFSFHFKRSTYGQKYWEYLYGYPDLGMRLTHHNYHNHMLGESITLVPYISFFPYRGQLSSFTWTMGSGLAYHTRPHHQTDNNLNVALGSHLTFALHCALHYQLMLGDHFAAGAFLQIDHFSNGAHTKPNSGINLMQAGVSLSRKLSRGSRVYREWDKQKLENRQMYVSLLPSVSFKELGNGGGQVLPSYNLHVSLNKPLGHMSTLNIGLEGFYDLAMRDWIARKSSHQNVDFKSAALTIGHELRVARVGLLTQMAYHIYQPYTGLFGSLYQRYGLRIYFHERVAFSGSLKTYLGKAEQVEWGFLFRL